MYNSTKAVSKSRLDNIIYIINMINKNYIQINVYEIIVSPVW